MRRPRLLETLLLAAAIAALTIPAAEAGGRATRTRPGAGSSATPASRVASGTATYGYTRGSVRPWGAYYSYYPYHTGLWDWYYEPWWSLGVSWGWPGWWYPYSPCWSGPCFSDGEASSSAPGFVETAVAPKRAKLFLDGEPIGEARDFNGTWDVLPLDPGSRVLRFEAEGYKTLEVTLDVRPGRHYRVAYALELGEGLDPRSSAPAATAMPPDAGARIEEPIPPPEGGIARGLLRVRVRPDDAVVYLDGEFLGRADEMRRLHGALPVAIGEHRIEVVRPGFRNERLRVEVVADEPAEVDLSLEPAE